MLRFIVNQLIEFVDILNEFNGAPPRNAPKKMKLVKAKPIYRSPPQGQRRIVEDDDLEGKEWDEDSEVLFHGTPKLEDAEDILYNNRWLIKKTAGNPMGVYFYPTRELATTKSGKTGYIVVLLTRHAKNLTNIGDNRYVALVPRGAKGTYYQIEGIFPIRIITPNGERIR